MNSVSTGMASYRLDEVNVRGNVDSIGGYFDARAMFEMFGRGKAYNSDQLYVVADNLNNEVPNFVGDRADLMEVYKKNFVRDDDWNYSYVNVKVELPTQTQSTRILWVETTDSGKLGFGQDEFEMSITSAGMNRKNGFALKDDPSVILRIADDHGMPDGHGSYKYRWKIYGEFEDYVTREKLLKGSKELVPIMGFAEEFIQDRATVDMTGMAKAYAKYRFDLTYMAHEIVTTDWAWQEGQHMMAVEDCEHDKGVGLPNLLFSDIDVNFFMKAEMIMDNWISFGNAVAPGLNANIDEMTKRPYRIGPSMLDFWRASGYEIYDDLNFNLLRYLDRFKRHSDISSNKEAENVVWDVFVGEAMFQHLIEPELIRLDQASRMYAPHEWHYMETEAQGDSRKQGVAINRLERNAIFLPYRGLVRFHVSKALSKGVLTGSRMYKDYPLSSWWMMYTVGNMSDKETMRNNNVYLYTDRHQEQETYLVGDFTPTGPIGWRQNTARYNSAGNLGKGYKTIKDQAKGFYIPNFNNMKLVMIDKG